LSICLRGLPVTACWVASLILMVSMPLPLMVRV
jgi:hypothetical protein